MKQVTITLYEFKELSEKAGQKALESLYDINVDHDWWESTYEDAERIGLKITGFDDYRTHGRFINSATETAELILKEHGEVCETYKTAQEFLREYAELVKKHSDGITLDKVCEAEEHHFDRYADDLEAAFQKGLLEDYRIILNKESEYLTSKEAIIETIEANEYFFTEDGKISNL